MHPSTFRKLIAMASIGAAVAFAHAQELPPGDAPEIRESGGIRYVSGGIGIEDVNRMRSLAPKFNVRIRFEDESNGGSLSDVVVVVLNPRDEGLLHLRTEGPLLYLEMPPGRYLLAMAYEDNVRQRRITVGRAPQQLTIGFLVTERQASWQPCRKKSDQCKRDGR